MNESSNLIDYWLRTIIVGMDLCPFARYPYERGLIRISLCDKKTENAWINFFFDELEFINEEEASSLSTTLMVLTNGPDDFNFFNDFVGDLESMLEESGLNSVFQLVSFHPKFCFADTKQSAVENFVNRSPLPVIQIIRTTEMNSLDLAPAKAEEISRLNSLKLKALTSNELKKLYYFLKIAD